MKIKILGDVGLEIGKNFVRSPSQVKYTYKDRILTIQSRNYNSNSNNGQSYVNSGNISVSVSGRTVIVNGKKYMMDANGDLIPEKSVPPDPNFKSMNFDIPAGEKITSISSSSGKLTGAILVNAFASDQEVDLHLSGTGGLSINENTFKSLNIDVSGVVDVRASVVVRKARVSLRGISTISGIHAMEEFIANAAGMGSITGSAEPGAEVDKDVSGMAKIHIARVTLPPKKVPAVQAPLAPAPAPSGTKRARPVEETTPAPKAPKVVTELEEVD